MRSPLAVPVAGAVVALLVLVGMLLTTHERRAFTLGVPLYGPATTLAPRDEICQAPVGLPDRESDFDRVAFVLATTHGRPGPQVDLTLKSLDGAPIARGHVPGGYAPSSQIQQVVDVGRVTTRTPMRVCLRNAGALPVAVFGSGDLASRTSTAALNGTPLGIDVAFSFEHAEPRSSLSLLPTLLNRMALWRAGWLGGWTYWLLAAGVLLAVPLLLFVALREVLADASRA